MLRLVSQAAPALEVSPTSLVDRRLVQAAELLDQVRKVALQRVLVSWVLSQPQAPQRSEFEHAAHVARRAHEPALVVLRAAVSRSLDGGVERGAGGIEAANDLAEVRDEASGRKS